MGPTPTVPVRSKKLYTSKCIRPPQFYKSSTLGCFPYLPTCCMMWTPQELDTRAFSHPLWEWVPQSVRANTTNDMTWVFHVGCLLDESGSLSGPEYMPSTLSFLTMIRTVPKEFYPLLYYIFKFYLSNTTSYCIIKNIIILI